MERKLVKVGNFEGKKLGSLFSSLEEYSMLISSEIYLVYFLIHNLVLLVMKNIIYARYRCYYIYVKWKPTA